jgi:hypothetical protein
VTTKKGKGITKIDAPKPAKTKHGSVIILGESVRVWSEVGVTVAVTDDPPQFLRFTFGHERIAPSSTQTDIKKTEALVNEFNEFILEKRLKQYQRMFRRSEIQVESESESSPGPRERAKARIEGDSKKKSSKAKKK